MKLLVLQLIFWDVLVVLFVSYNWAMLWPLHGFCRSAKETSPDDRLECFRKREKTSSRRFYHIYLVFSTFYFTEVYPST